MTDCAIDTHSFVEALRASIPDAIHPSAQAACHELCHELHLAVGDDAELKRLMGRFRARIASELRWEACKRDGLPGMADEIAELRAQADAVDARMPTSTMVIIGQIEQ
jgi:hypothetical protein